MLKEKQPYHFRVIRLVTMPDGTRDWLLTHDGDDRYLLPEAHYHGYGIEEGANIVCRVDKVNCAGRIFLEPEHPLYSEGAVYGFRCQSVRVIRDEAGNQLKQLFLTGTRNDGHSCILMGGTPDPLPGDIIRVRIVRIKKGELVLEPADLREEGVLREGNVYEFNVLELKDGFIEAAGPGGIRVLLEEQHYSRHGLEPGKNFKGHFLKWTEAGSPRVEPLHPLYNPGETYPFRVVRRELSGHPFGEKMPVLIVEDCFGNEIKVFAATGEPASGDLPPEVRCRVVRLKKGRPVLRIA